MWKKWNFAADATKKTEEDKENKTKTANEIKAKHQNQSEARNKIRFKWNEMK